MAVRVKINIVATAALATALVFSGTVSAQDRSYRMLAQNKNNGNSSGPNRNAPPGKRHAGDWLRRYQNLPPQDQEKALSNDPQFQSLPADRQSNLRNHLRSFN